MEKIKVEAKVENLQQVLEFITSRIEEAGGGMKAQMQIEVAAEELFVNIASYAYEGNSGDAEIAIEIENNVKITCKYHVYFIFRRKKLGKFLLFLIFSFVFLLITLIIMIKIIVKI